MDSRAENDPSFYLYVLECADGTWYTGAGAKYTRSRLPVRLLAQAAYATKHEAMSAEYRFKRLTRRQKERLVRRAAREPFEQVLSDLMPAAGVREDTEGVDVGGEAR